MEDSCYKLLKFQNKNNKNNLVNKNRTADILIMMKNKMNRIAKVILLNKINKLHMDQIAVNPMIWNKILKKRINI